MNINKILVALVLGLPLVGCTDGSAQYPALVDAAREQCAGRGGLAYDSFKEKFGYDRIRIVTVVCADGVVLEFEQDYRRKEE